jgi:hypothetical protein
MANEITRTLVTPTLVTATITSPVVTGVPRIIGCTSVNLTSNATTTSATYVDMTGLTLSVTAVTGDILVIDCGLAHNLGATSGGIMRLMVVDGGTEFCPGPMAASDEAQLSNNPRWVNLTCAYTVITSGTVTVKVQGHTSASVLLTFYGTAAPSTSTSTTQSSSNIRILHLRSS